MNAPPFPIAPEVGQWFGAWAWSGSHWVAAPTAGLRRRVVVFDEDGPYTPSSGLVSLTVECLGGGGGGGDAFWNGPTGDRIISGGGGGSGGYSRKTLPAVLVRGGVPVTVGTGGVGNYPGNSTSFGALCLANGGGAGVGYNGIDQWGGVGLGAAAGIGDIALAGTAGTLGSLQVTPAGAPALEIVGMGGQGGSIFGGGGAGQAIYIGATAEGVPGAPGSGAGGSGGCINQVTGSGQHVGGQGGSGLCVVTEFLWGDHDQPRPPLDVNVSFPRPPWPWWPWRPPGAWGPRPGPRPRQAVEFEADQPTFQPWGDPNASDD